MSEYYALQSKFIYTVLLLLLLAVAPDISAEIFKCIDKATGQIAFTDQACPDNTPGNYQPIGSTNIDTDSASLNEAGSKALRDGAKRTSHQTWVSRAKDAESQPTARPAATTAARKKPLRDTLWHDRRMCQKRRNCESCCYDQYPLPK